MFIPKGAQVRMFGQLVDPVPRELIAGELIGEALRPRTRHVPRHRTFMVSDVLDFFEKRTGERAQERDKERVAENAEAAYIYRCQYMKQEEY